MKNFTKILLFIFIAILYKFFDDRIFYYAEIIKINDLIDFKSLFPESLPLFAKKRNSEWINLLLTTAFFIHLIRHTYAHFKFRHEFEDISRELANSQNISKNDVFSASLQLTLSVVLAIFILYREIHKTKFLISDSFLNFGLWIIVIYIVSDAIFFPIKYLPLLSRVLFINSHEK